MKKVLITGANGFIAKNIARTLKASGLNVIGTSRNPAPLKNYDEVVRGILGKPLKDVFETHAIDAIVHCAFDKDEVENVKNAEGTHLWAEQAGENNVGLQIFMSSISADEIALAPYGQKKYEVEKWFIEHNQIVFRLGLVVGRGGLFGRIISTVRNSPIIPLIDMGRTLFYPSDVDTISFIVLETVTGENNIERGKIWYLQQETPVCFADILKEIRKQYGLFRVFVPVPYFAVSIMLNLIEKLKFLKLGISTNNLKGLRQVKEKTFKSDLGVLGYQETPIEILIKKTVK
jgi:nucleoside-diphosphate-sugar epimerase